MKLNEIQTRLEEIRAKAVEFLDQMKVEGLTESRKEELDRSYDAAMDEFDTVKRDAERAIKLNEVDAAITRYADPAPEGKPPVPDVKGAAPKEDGLTYEDAFRAMLRHRGPLDLMPAEVRSKLSEGYHASAAQGETRAQSSGTDSEGGYTIPEGFMAELIRVMLAWGPMLDPGVTRELITDGGEKIPWPKANDTGNTGGTRSEGSTITEQAITFSEVELNSYPYDSGMVLLSWFLLQDTGLPIQQIIASMLGERLGRSINTVLTTGDGSEKPHGIVTASQRGVDNVAKTGWTVAKIYDLFHSVDPAYRMSPQFAWMMNDTTLGQLRKITYGAATTDTRPLWQMGDISKGFSDVLLGKPAYTNQAMAPFSTSRALSILVGDFSKYIVRKVRGMQMVTMTERYAPQRQNGYFAWCRVDGAMLDDTAIKHGRSAA